MSLRVQVNLGDEMLRQVDYYADVMGVSRSALCSVLISAGIYDFNSKQIQQLPDNLAHLFPIEKRVQRLFDGWAAQFENMPDYKPNIEVNDGKVYVDEQYLCDFDAEVSGGEIDCEGVTIIFWGQNDEFVKMYLHVEWQEGKKPFINKISKIE